MQHQDTIDRVREIILPVLDDSGLELFDIELKGARRDLVLTIFIDKEGGVNLDDCAAVSREVSTLLDVEEVIQGSYRLEVSSPGLDRPLKKPQDYIKFSGKLIKIKTREKCDPDHSGRERKTFRGRILGIEGEFVRIELEEKSGTVVSIPMDNIEKANLELDF
ncbi:MAG: ribosome maturation factor [Deltaproteobacteria bacterium]|nr:ribosome maturation factor [Deltaproteobacteria bacterium]